MMQAQRRASSAASLGIGGGAARPSSAPRRRPPPAASGFDRRQFHPCEGGGLARQASAPILAPAGPGGNLSFDTLSRSAYDHSRSPGGMKRSSSVTSLGGRPAQRAGNSYSSVPRRRPYEGLNSTPDHFDAHAGARAGYAGLQHKLDAAHLENRLAERLQNDLVSAEPTQRPADPRRRAASHADLMRGGSGASPYGGKYPPAGLLDSHYAHAAPAHGYLDVRMAPHGQGSVKSSPAARVPSRGASPWQERRSAASSPYQHSHFSSHCGGSRLHDDESSLPESRLKIYSDLFEEVIDRDRVFGSLLRKVKTAYDSILSDGAAVPSMPGAAVPSMDSYSTTPGGQGRQHLGAAGGFHSGEPTLRANDGGQAWEIMRENQVLKDLVERLHLELEEAVKREQRWKHKATKLKARAAASSGAGPPIPMPPSMPPQPQCCAGFNYPPEIPWPGPFEQTQNPMMQMQMPMQIVAPEEPQSSQASGHAKGTKSFHPSRREPTLSEMEAQEGVLNQGGLLSLSSISPQNSQPPPAESMDQGHGAVSGAESARSTDSGMLPQRPTRRQFVKPARVPSLDFSRLKIQLDDEEDEEDDGQYEDELEGDDMAGRVGPLQLGSESGYSPRDGEPDGGYHYAEAVPESD